MRVRAIDLQSRRDVDRFVQFPFALYAPCEQWVPPLLRDLRRILDRKSSAFYRRSDAAFLIAESDSDVLGRIMVMDHRPYNDYHRARTAFFYYFDCVDDDEVARALFDSAREWAAARGRTRIVGPKGPTRGDGLGLLIDGHEHRAAMGIPYNYPYYDALVCQCGFRKEIDYLSGYLDAGREIPKRFYRLAEAVKARRGFSIKRFATKDDLRACIPAVMRVNNEAFRNVWGYYPLDEDETLAVAERILSIADPRLIKLVMKDEEIVGFILAYHDLSAALQRCRGRLLPLGWWHLKREYARTDWVCLNGLGLLPEHQGLGANTLLYTELAKSAHEFGFKHADLAQVAENNIKSLGDAKAGGACWYKRHRIYTRDV